MKTIFLAFLVALPLLASAQDDDQTTGMPDQKYHYNTVYDYAAPDLVPYRFNAAELVQLARSFVGTAYLPNGKDPAGFDCSGFTFYLFKNYGVYLPYFSSQQAEIGTPVEMPAARPGDLIFFKGYDQASTTVGHVGVVVSKKGEKLTWVHATTSKGVRVDDMSNKYYLNRFLAIRRVAE